MQPPNLNPTYLSQLPCLYPIEGGNHTTRIQIIGQDDQQNTPKYVKKTITLNEDNQRYAYAERTMMQIINSDYVIKLLHWEEVQQQQVSKSRIGRQSQLVQKKLILYMPFCEKGDLRSFLINEKPSIEKRVQIVLDILYAMRFLHEKFIIHRDMKLQNVFVTKDNQIKIADLGIASQTFSIAQTEAGTFGQQAPQVYLMQKGGYDQKADVWSVGYMAFQIVNRVIRKQEELGREIRDPYLPKDQLRLRVLQSHGGNLKQNYLKSFQQNKLIFNPEVPHALKYLIGKMLMPKRDERVSFREIYEGGYLQKLEEEWGEKVGRFRNYRALVEDYKRLYVEIQEKKKGMEQNDLLYTIVIRLNEQIQQKLYPSGIVSPIVSPHLVDLLILQFLLLHRLRAIYTQTKQLQCFTLKKKIQQQVNNIGTRYLQIRNSVQDYLKVNNRKPINQNPELMSNQYFVKLLNDMAVKYVLDVERIVELVGGQ